MTNHPNRSKQSPVTFTVFDEEDSSWYRDSLSEKEACELLSERNRENSKYGDRYKMVIDAEFLAFQAGASEG